MSQQQLLAKRIGLVALTNLLIEANSLIMLPLLTKNLPISEYGIWIQISVTIGLVPAIALLGLPYSMVRFLPSAHGRENIREIFYSMAGIITLAALAAALTIYLLSEPIAAVLFEGRQIIVQYLSALILLECLINIPFAYFRSLQQIKKYSAFNFSKVFLGLLLVIYFVISGKGLSGALSGLLLADIVIFLSMSILVISEIGVSIPKFTNIKKYLSFGMPTIPGNLSNWIINSSNRYVIGILMGTTFVGYFSPGYTLGNMVSLFIAPISFILPAALSKCYDDKDINEVKSILELSLKTFLTLGIPAAFGLSILSLPILNVLSTPEIAENGYRVTPFMALGALFFGAYAIVAQVMTLEKNTLLTSKIWIFAAMLNLILSILLVTAFGIIGAALASLISFAFTFVAASYYSHRSVPISFRLIFVAKSLAASLVMSLMLQVLSPEGVAELVPSVAAGALVYFLILIALRGFSREELAFIRALR